MPVFHYADDIFQTSLNVYDSSRCTTRLQGVFLTMRDGIVLHPSLLQTKLRKDVDATRFWMPSVELEATRSRSRRPVSEVRTTRCIIKLLPDETISHWQ